MVWNRRGRMRTIVPGPPGNSIDWEELQIPPSGRDDKGSAVTYLGSCDLGCVDFRVEGSSEFPSGRD
jgi:hypothetical protein